MSLLAEYNAIYSQRGSFCRCMEIKRLLREKHIEIRGKS